ncbi:MAG: HPr(Ser) kinase/phosphatase [Parasporobacterium sp.]|nr:HPr(Ser) kinase/phosphatase [Parasporobacterium sp.]
MERKFVRLDEIAKKFGYKNLTPGVDLHEVKIYHRNINRPAFQLTGYYEYFDNKRVQVVGRAEHMYLQKMGPSISAERLRHLFSSDFPAAIIARGIVPPEYVIDIAKEFQIPILSTEKTTALVIVEFVKWMNEQLAETASINGVLANVYGEGILITGPSGIGKSEAALELIKRGHRFVADDVVDISKVSEDILMGRSPELTRNFIELRGLGVVDVMSLYGVECVMEYSPINMIINLEEWDGSSNYDRLGLHEDYEEILGLKIVKHTIPIRPGRNLAIIIETAAVNNRQKKMGYNAAQELCDRVTEEIHKHKREAEAAAEKQQESRKNDN